MEIFGDKAFTIITSNVFAGLFGVSTIWLAYHLGRNNGTHLVNWLICLIGALGGWIVGTLASPYSSEEAQTFLTIGQAVTAFLSGYVVSKLDRFLERTLYTDGSINTESWLRLCLFIASFLLVAIIVFINRLYFEPNN